LLGAKVFPEKDPAKIGAATPHDHRWMRGAAAHAAALVASVHSNFGRNFSRNTARARGGARVISKKDPAKMGARAIPEK